MLQQTILSKLFELINCENYKFDDLNSQSFLKNYVGIKCFDENHYWWIFSLILPSFTFYAIFIPISATCFATIKKLNMGIRSNIIKYDFLMRQPYNSSNPSFWFFYLI